MSSNAQPETDPLLDGLDRAYSETRQSSIDLLAPLAPEDCVVQSIPEVSPTKWHLAHVTWFFERFCLLEHEPSYRAFDEQFLYLFNSYYYSVGQMHGRAQRGLLSRPLLQHVLEYREHVDAAMRRLIRKRCEDANFAHTVILGCHHEQQHQELLLTDIKHVFFCNPIGPAYVVREPSPASAAGQHRFVTRPGGRFAIGYEGREFCFDNETPHHDVLVDEHALGSRLVTNAEYRQFIDAGGYGDTQLWLADGWTALNAKQWRRPLYWSEDCEREFTLAGWQPIDAAAPVTHVSLYEADAFARWAGARLPLESEWELAANTVPVNGNTLDRARFHPQAADASDRAPLQQIWGDVWEWTSSPYGPYPKFRPLAGSLGEYNGKFMSNQMVVRGGSCATWAAHLRPTYRSFFYPHDRWQFLGIRLAKDLP